MSTGIVWACELQWKISRQLYISTNTPITFYAKAQFDFRQVVYLTKVFLFPVVYYVKLFCVLFVSFNVEQAAKRPCRLSLQNKKVFTNLKNPIDKSR